MRYFIFLLTSALCVISFVTAAQNAVDSALYFKALTKTIGVPMPKLREGEYQIRVWVKIALKYGQAHDLYVTTVKRKRIKLKKIEISSNKEGYLKHATTVKSTIRNSDFSARFLQNGSFPARPQNAVIDSLRKIYRTKRAQHDNSTRVEMSGDTVRVIAKKQSKGEIIVGDGTSYYFEVFGKGFFQRYDCHCPKSYAEFYTESPELQHSLQLLLLIFSAYQEPIHTICHVPSGSHNSFAGLQRSGNAGSGYSVYFEPNLPSLATFTD